MFKRYSIALTVMFLLPIASFAQEMSEADIAKASQNPVTMIYSLPIQNNIYFGIGPNEETKNIANFQPVIPIGLSKNWDVVFRMIMPITTVPATLNPYGDGGVTGIGDITLTAFFAPKNVGKIIWAAGAVLYMPTATTEALRTQKWGAGPSVVALKMSGAWVFGALVMNFWSFAGPDDYVKEINTMQIQPFVNYNFGKTGWFLSSVPIIFANWTADSDNRWTVPLGGGVGKAFKLGKVPITLITQAFYNVITPERFGEQWQLRLQGQIFFPRNQN